MNGRPKIIIHLAGHDFHPVYEQAAALVHWLGPEYWCHTAESLAALEHLSECDLLVFIGMYFTGWEGRYRTPGEVHKRALERYIAAGRPVILSHGAIASYDDWDRFAELMGITFRGAGASFTPRQNHFIRIAQPAHALTAQVSDFELADAIPTEIEIDPMSDARVVAETAAPRQGLPVVIAAEGGRVPGAGKVAYLANGSDMAAFQHPGVRQIWMNAVGWCLSGA